MRAHSYSRDALQAIAAESASQIRFHYRFLSGVSGEGNFSRPRSGREKFTSLRTEDLGVAWGAFDAFLVNTSPPSF